MIERQYAAGEPAFNLAADRGQQRAEYGDPRFAL
jgi:hypothetical protein